MSFTAHWLGVGAASISQKLKCNRRSDGHNASKRHCTSLVKACRNDECKEFEPEWRKRTRKAPWVCNGCGARPTYRLERFTNSTKVAQAKVDGRLVVSRRELDVAALPRWSSWPERSIRCLRLSNRCASVRIAQPPVLLRALVLLPYGKRAHHRAQGRSAKEGEVLEAPLGEVDRTKR